MQKRVCRGELVGTRTLLHREGIACTLYSWQARHVNGTGSYPNGNHNENV